MFDLVTGLQQNVQVFESSYQDLSNDISFGLIR